MASFETHCQQTEIKTFFERYCLADHGVAAKSNVCIYSDEPAQCNTPKL